MEELLLTSTFLLDLETFVVVLRQSFLVILHQNPFLIPDYLYQ